MWRIQNLEKGQVTLDFSSAGLGSFRTSALIADDTTIVNATTLIEMEDDGRRGLELILECLLVGHTTLACCIDPLSVPSMT